MAAQIDHDPGDIAQEGDGDGGTDEREQGLHHAQADHIVSALRAVTWREHTQMVHMPSRDSRYFFPTHTRTHQQRLTYDVAQGPDRLFTHVLVRGVKQPQEQRHSIYTKRQISINHRRNLVLGCRALTQKQLHKEDFHHLFRIFK